MTYLEKLKSLESTIGNTDLLRLEFLYNNKNVIVFAKEEYQNPSKSIKIRPAFQIILDAILSGELKENQRVVEVTSGNMGIALTYICKKIGNPITILMPKTMSKERIEILKNMGAEIELTNDFLEAFEKEKEYEKNGAFLTKQFDNISNTKAHSKTASEIVEKTQDFEAFISGVGTGGTLIGCGKYLKDKYNKKVIAIDPEESSMLNLGVSKGAHKIQGLSDQIIPSLYDKKIVDKIISISSDDAIVMARKIKEVFGVGVGISSGANILGAILSGFSSIATVFADDDTKYYSTDLFNPNINSNLVDKIKLVSIRKI